MFSDADELFGEDAGFFCCLSSLRGVALGAAACLEDGSFGFTLDNLELCNVAVQLARILPDELVAFPNLHIGLALEYMFECVCEAGEAVEGS